VRRSGAFAVVTAIFGLAACSQGLNPAQSLAPSQDTPASQFVAAGAQRTNAKQQNLLYVGSGSTISMYSYADGNIGGLVGSFQVGASAGSLCIDNEQRVYVPYRELRKGYIARYEHAATQPDLTQHFQQGAPLSCSYDNDYARLAILNKGYHFYYWNVIVLPGRGKYVDPESFVNSIAYSSAGTLFLVGTPYGSYTSQLNEVRHSDLRPVAMTLTGGTITSPGPLAWGNPYLLLVDEQYEGGNTPGIYQLSISGTTAKIVGGFALSSTSHAASIVKVADKLIVADDEKGAIEVYDFPGGTLYATFTPFSGVTSAVVSQSRR
jgi:hypothetical protein